MEKRFPLDSRLSFSQNCLMFAPLTTPKPPHPLKARKELKAISYPLCDEQQFIFDVNESIKTLPMMIMFSGTFSERFSRDEIRRAVETCVQTADVCNARCVVKEACWHMEFLPPHKPEIRSFHFSTEEEYQRFRDQIIETEINNRDKLYHIFMFSIAGSLSHRIYFCFNHLIFDGLSALVLFEKIKNILINPDAGMTLHPFSAFLKKKEDYKKSAKYLSDQQFWEERFAELAKCETLFEDVSDVKEASIRELCFHTTKTFKQACFSYCSQKNIALHLLIVAILAEQIHTKTGRKRFYLEIPIGNRLGTKEKNSIGIYEISPPYIFDFNQHDNLADLVASLQQQTKNYYRHKDFDWNAAIYSEPYQKKYGPYIPQFCFSFFCSNTYLNVPFVHWYHLHAGSSFLPMTIYVHDFMDSETMTFSYVFWESYFTDEEITGMHKEMEARMTEVINSQPKEVHPA